MAFRLANVEGRAAVVVEGSLHDVAAATGDERFADPQVALAHPEMLANLEVAGRPHQGWIGDVRLGPPVPRPGKVFAIGLNYAAHADEGNFEVPEHPLVFTKFPSCIVGPTADLHLRSDRCDYEGELVAVIGKPGKDLDRNTAVAHIAGFMVGQDVSDRRTQFAAKPAHFALGKSFDTFGPTGPVLVSSDAVDLDTLRIRTWVNGEERQNDAVNNMIFDVPTLIAYLSRVTRLETGDLVFTGTPEGIGAMRRLYLTHGDVVRTTIDGLGTLENRCVRVSDHGLRDLVRRGPPKG